MTFDQLLQWTIALVSAILSYVIRELWVAVQKLRADISDLESKLPIQFVQKDDYRLELGRVMDQLDRIYNKLDKKIDK
jgi:hypothetical protein